MSIDLGLNAANCLSAILAMLLATSAQAAQPDQANLTDDELLELVQRQTFRYFYDYGHPDCGMARERSAPANRGTSGHVQLEHIVTTGGTGFGLIAFPIAVEREWIARDDAVKRLLKIVRFLESVPRFHGMWAHWYMGHTGEVRPFSTKGHWVRGTGYGRLGTGNFGGLNYFETQSQSASPIM